MSLYSGLYDRFGNANPFQTWAQNAAVNPGFWQTVGQGLGAGVGSVFNAARTGIGLLPGIFSGMGANRSPMNQVSAGGWSIDTYGNLTNPSPTNQVSAGGWSIDKYGNLTSPSSSYRAGPSPITHFTGSSGTAAANTAEIGKRNII